ncbi:hypothetical protein ACS5PN_09510 [Roseateles sp. NT4]|uniref:hypothetical protein n=1 Tax=Roseateles sp. NT4 TaxID=3453715 RepID=UPI003EE921CB
MKAQLMRPALIGIGLTILMALTSVKAAPQVEQLGINIAEPIVRPDFKDRIWTLEGSELSPVSHSVVLANPRDIDRYQADWPPGQPAPQTVFVAGVGYLSSSSGAKNTFLINTGNGPRNLALLVAVIPAEGLTNARLSLFDPRSTVPQCQIPITVRPGSHDYGNWQVLGVYRLAKGAYMAWLEASGGDGGYTWSSHVFARFGERCELLSHQIVHVAAGGADAGRVCSAGMPAPQTLIAPQADGSVRTKKPPRNCAKVRMSDGDPGIRVGG